MAKTRLNNATREIIFDAIKDGLDLGKVVLPQEETA